MSNIPPEHDNALPPRLGPYTAVMVVMGSMIGSGIFKKPAIMAAQLRSGLALLSAWIGAGLVTLCGALTNSELASMFPEAGGQYVYFRRTYNYFVAFLYGWAVFSVIQTGSIASIAYVFAEYLNGIVALPRPPEAWEQVSFSLFGVVTITPFANLGVKLGTIACIMLLTGVNVLGVAFGGAIQNAFTTFKALAIAGLVFFGFRGSSGKLAANLRSWSPRPGQPIPGVALWATAFSGAFWAYDGWNNLTFLSAEVRSPQRNIPRALALGTAAVVVIYLLTNLAYLSVLSIDRMAGSELVARDMMQQIIGPLGGRLIAMLVMLSAFGATNGSILATSRVSFAMARDGLFFAPLGRIHKKFRTPHIALWAQGVWASLLTLTGTFDQLTDMLIMVSWIFYALGAAGVFILRRTHKDHPRPYRVWGYPFTPVLFVLFASFFVITTAAQDIRNAVFGLFLVALGIPIYLLRRQRSA